MRVISRKQLKHEWARSCEADTRLFWVRRDAVAQRQKFLAVGTYTGLDVLEWLACDSEVAIRSWWYS